MRTTPSETEMIPTDSTSAEPSTPAGHGRTGKLAWLIATFFGCGRLRPGPGSWASAATVLLWWAFSHAAGPAIQILFAVLLACLAVTLGTPAATRVARESGISDPSFVVIDEVAGQL